MMNIFEMMEQNKAMANGTDSKVKETKTTETKVEETKTTGTKVEETKSSSKSSSKKEAPKKQSSDEIKESKLKEFTEIEVKVFGTTVLNIVEESEIENIKLSSIRNNLIEMGYQELRGKVSWLTIPDADNIKCILTVIPAFQNKG